MSKGILLDTNVLSELMRRQPAAAVLGWFAHHARAAMHTSAMYTSAVNQAEIFTSFALLPAGKRRTALLDAAEQMFEVDFNARCLQFNSAAAKNYAVIVAARTLQGRPISTEDAQIAAIAQAAGLTLATRNTKDFDLIDDLLLANPWDDRTNDDLSSKTSYKVPLAE